jgi:hypothetical protein
LCGGVGGIEEDGECVGATMGTFGFGDIDGVYVSDGADARDILGVCGFKYGIGGTKEDGGCVGATIGDCGSGVNDCWCEENNECFGAILVVFGFVCADGD